MKLRLRGNSIRIRLTQAEVKALDQTGRCEDAVLFGPTSSLRLTYRVEAGAVPRPSAAMSVLGHETVVAATLPQEQITRWANGSDVGIYFEESWGLKVAVEKDFRCLDEVRDEDESDNFDHPKAVGSVHGACHAD